MNKRGGKNKMTNDKTQAGLDALAFVCRTLGWLEVVPPYGDAVLRTKECDKAIESCAAIRAALTAQEQIDALYGTIKSQKQTHDALIKMNKELLGALEEAKSVISSINYKGTTPFLRDGGTFYGQTDDWCEWALNEILPVVRQAIARAEIKTLKTLEDQNDQQ